MLVSARFAAVLAAGTLLCVVHLSAASTVHTVFATECTPYFTWQTLGMIYSHRKSGQPGQITRLMSCSKEELDALSEVDRNIVPTHIAPSFTKHPRTGDLYSAYNKPVAVIDWLAKNKVEEDFILVLDADMIMREPFMPDELGVRPGRAVSAFYGYLKGVNNKLALKHVPEVLPRNDTDAGPLGRRGDQVGGFIFQHQSDLRKMAPLWLKFSEDVRADPDAWELSGDSYSTHPGDKPWISEMYGYSFGAAKANVWHTCHRTAMLYPGYDTSEPPKVLHYGLLYEVQGTGYKFDKHWHYDFNPLQCPPWRQTDSSGGKKGGLFPHPPSPSSLTTQGLSLLRDLLGLEVPITLNAAFCEYLLDHCPPSDELAEECAKVRKLSDELDAAFNSLELPDPCQDMDPRCPEWSDAGECIHNAAFMDTNCRLSCKVCLPREHKPHTQSRGRAAGQREPDSEPGSFQDERVPDQQGVLPLPRHTAGKGRVGMLAGKEPVLGNAPNFAELKRRCKTSNGLTMPQVLECLKQAEQGIKFDPATMREGGDAGLTRDGAAAGEDAQEDGEDDQGGDGDDDTEGDRADGVEQLGRHGSDRGGWRGGDGGGGEEVEDGQDIDDSGDGDEDEDEDDVLTDAVLSDSSGLGRGRGSRLNELDQSRTHRDDARWGGQHGVDAVGVATMLQKYGVMGMMFWASAIVLFFCVLPRAKRWRRTSSRTRKLGRMD